MLFLLLTLACSSHSSRIVDPGDGLAPSRALLPDATLSRVHYWDGSGARLETPLQQRSRRIDRWVTDDDVHRVERHKDGVLWWGSAALGFLERPILLVPEELRGGMIWESRDGSGGITHRMTATRSGAVAFGSDAASETEDAGVVSWTVSVEEVAGLYEPDNLTRTHTFLFYEGAGLMDVSTGASWDQNAVAITSARRIAGMVVQEDATFDALEPELLSLTATSHELEAEPVDVSARTLDDGSVGVFVAVRERSVVQGFDPATGLPGWFVQTQSYGQCYRWNGTEVVPEEGCPASYGTPPDPVALATSSSPAPGWSFDPEDRSWSGLDVHGLLGATSTHAFVGARQDGDGALVQRDDAMVWSSGSVRNGRQAWPANPGFVKAGVPRLHQLDGGTHDALVVDADGLVWQATHSSGGPTLELLAALELPDGHRLTGAVRSPQGDRLLVVTTAGRFEPIGASGVDADPQTSHLWLATLSTPPLPVDDPTAIVGVNATMAGWVGCSSTHSVTSLDIAGVTGPTEQTSAYGGQSCVAREGGFEVDTNFRAVAPQKATLSGGGGAITLYRTRRTAGFLPSLLLPTVDPFWLDADAVLTRPLRYNAFGLPDGPGWGESIGSDEPVLFEPSTGTPISFGAGTAARASWPEGFSIVELQPDTSTVTWTDGVDPSRDVVVPFSSEWTDAVAWPDGRACWFDDTLFECTDADGAVRAGVFPDARASVLGHVVQESHLLRITAESVIAVDPVSATATRVLDVPPLVPLSGPPALDVNGDLWLKTGGDTFVRIQGETAAFFTVPPSAEDRQSVLEGDAIVVVDEHLLTATTERNASDRIVRRVGRRTFTSSEPPPPPTPLPSGTRVGAVTVGDVPSPGTDLQAGPSSSTGLQPAQTLPLPASSGVVYHGAGYQVLGPDGSSSLAFDGTQGSPDPWSTVTDAVFGVASVGGGYALLQDTDQAFLFELSSGTETPLPFVGTGYVFATASDVDPLGNVVYARSSIPGGYGLVSRSADGVEGAPIDVVSYDPHVALAPGGRLLAVAEQSDRVRLVDTLSGGWVADLHTDTAILELAFDPTGRMLAVHTNDALEIWTVGAGPPVDAFQSLGELSLLQRDALAWSPGGDQIVVVGSELWVVAVDTLGPSLLASVPVGDAYAQVGSPPPAVPGSIAWAPDGSEFTYITDPMLRFTVGGAP